MSKGHFWIWQCSIWPLYTADIRRNAFNQYIVTKVNVKKRLKYMYMKFAAKYSCGNAIDPIKTEIRENKFY